MSIDAFAYNAASVIDPARQAFPVTPSDAVELAVLPRGLYVGTGGTIILRAVDSAADVTLKSVAAGQTIDIRARFVRATGTTAADIIGLA